MKRAIFKILKLDPGAAKFIGFAKQQCQRLIDNGTDDFYRFWNMGGGATIKARSYCGSVKLWLEASSGGWLIGDSNISPSGTQTEYYYPTTTAKYNAVANNIALTETTLSKTLVFNYLPKWLGMPNDVGNCYVWLSDPLYGAGYALNPATGNYDITVTVAKVSDSSKIISYTLPESVVYGTVDPTSPGANVNIAVDIFMLAGRATALIAPDGITPIFAPGTPILWDIESGVLRSSPEMTGYAPLQPFIDNQWGMATANYGWTFSLVICAFKFDATTNSFEVVQHTPPSPFTSAVRVDTNASKEAVNFRYYADTTSGVYYYSVTDVQVAAARVVSVADANTFFAAGLIAYGVASGFGTPNITSIQQAANGVYGFVPPASLTATGFFDVLACSWPNAPGIILLGVTQSGFFDIFNFNPTGVIRATSSASSSYYNFFGVLDGYWYGSFSVSGSYEASVYDAAFNLLAQESGYLALCATPTGIYFTLSYSSGPFAKVYQFATSSVASLTLVSAPLDVIATPDVDILVCPASGAYTIYGYYPDGTLVNLGSCSLSGNIQINRFCYYDPKSRRLFIEHSAVVINVGKKTEMALVTNLSFLPVALGSPPNFNPYSAYLPTYYPAQSDWAADWVTQCRALQPP